MAVDGWVGVITRIKANLSSIELGLTSQLELSLAKRNEKKSEVSFIIFGKRRNDRTSLLHIIGFLKMKIGKNLLIIAALNIYQIMASVKVCIEYYLLRNYN